MDINTEERKSSNAPFADEAESNTHAKKSNPLGGLTSGDKTFVETLIAIVLVYLGKRFFDSSDKAVDRGYEVKLSAKQYGDLSFKPGTKISKATETVDSRAEEASNPEESDANDGMEEKGSGEIKEA